MIAHYINDSCTPEWLSEMLAMEHEPPDHDAVMSLPYPTIRSYPFHVETSTQHEGEPE